MIGETAGPDETLIRDDFSSVKLEEAEAVLSVGDEKVKGKEESRSWGWTWIEFKSNIGCEGDLLKCNALGSMDSAVLRSRSIGKEKSNGLVRSETFIFWSMGSTGCCDQNDES